MKLLYENNFTFLQLRMSLSSLLVWLFFISLYLLITLAADHSGFTEISWFVPLTILILFSTTLIRLINKNRAFLLTPMPIFFGSVALFLGLGPLVMFFGPAEAFDMTGRFFPTSSTAYFRVQVLTVSGLFFTIFAIWLLVILLHHNSKRLVSRTYQKSSVSTESLGQILSLNQYPSSQLSRAAILFLFIAIVLRILQYGLGYNFAVELPGFLHLITKIGWLAVYLFSILAARKGGIYWAFLLFSLSLEVIAGFLTLFRHDILSPILVAVLGFYLGGKTKYVLYGGVFCVILIMLVTRPVVDYVRMDLHFWNQAGTHEILSSYLSLNHEDLANTIVQATGEGAWWQRLNYAQVQAAVMNLYDEGNPGKTYSLIPWTFVPRVLFPAKPAFDSGGQAREAIFGFRDSTSIGVTVYGEAYWNGGWPFVFISALIYGFFLITVTVACLWLFGSGRLSAWPLGFLGILYGFTVNNSFATAATGGFIIILYLLITYYFFVSLTSGVRWRNMNKKITGRDRRSPIIR